MQVQFVTYEFSGTEQVIFGSNVLFLGEKHPFLGKVLSLFWKRRMQGVTGAVKSGESDALGGR